MHRDTPWSSVIRLFSVPEYLVDAMRRLSSSPRRRLFRPQGTYQDRLFFCCHIRAIALLDLIMQVWSCCPCTGVSGFCKRFALAYLARFKHFGQVHEELGKFTGQQFGDYTATFIT